MRSQLKHPPFETVIPCSPVDLNKLPYVIDSLVTHTDTTGVHVITPDPKQSTLHRSFRVPVHLHADNEVIAFDRSRFKHRPNWIFQQFLKLFQNVTKTNWYLVIDADLLFNHDVKFFTDEQPVFMFGHDQYHDPYFVFNQLMIRVGKVHPYSFLSECTLYSKELVSKMLKLNGYNSSTEFMEKAARIISNDIYPADSELYGSFVVAHYPTLYAYRRLKAVLGGKYGGKAWSTEEIENRIKEISKQDADIFTIHSWEGSV